MNSRNFKIIPIILAGFSVMVFRIERQVHSDRQCSPARR